MFNILLLSDFTNKSKWPISQMNKANIQCLIQKINISLLPLFLYHLALSSYFFLFCSPPPPPLRTHHIVMSNCHVHILLLLTPATHHLIVQNPKFISFYFVPLFCHHPNPQFIYSKSPLFLSILILFTPFPLASTI